MGSCLRPLLAIVKPIVLCSPSVGVKHCWAAVVYHRAYVIQVELMRLYDICGCRYTDVD